MKSDKELGMHTGISRRDFVQGMAVGVAGVAGMGSAPLSQAVAEASATAGGSSHANDYPPSKTGLRGSHPGSYENAHALALEGKGFPEARALDERYDLVVVGAGISGLAAAHYYQQRFGSDARILILENHDDFGGHARRNEFHQAGNMRLSMGGVHNLEWWNFSDNVWAFMKDFGIDVQAMREQRDFAYGRTAKYDSSMWFDKETFGVDKLVTGLAIDVPGGASDAKIDEIPISEEGRASLKRLYARTDTVLDEMGEQAREDYLRSISYPEFLKTYGGLTDDAIALFNKLLHGGWGAEMRALSAQEVLEEGFPGYQLVGLDVGEGRWDYPVAMWPDGNASLARLQVARLIPEVAPGTSAENIALASFDYDQLDKPERAVRLRLSSTVVNVSEANDAVAVSYIRDGEVVSVQARHTVLACYHVIIPHLCPQLPAAQREAMKYQVKSPLFLTNVLIRNTDALDVLGIDSVRCPGRLMENIFTFRGINTGGYVHPIDDTGAVALVMWGMPSPPDSAITRDDQHRASRAIMLGLSFEDYEREVRRVLDGLLGPAGFDVANDILAITVNRWPHGYSLEYLDLWDDDWPPGEAPHEIARQPFGRITIANADAGASAYTQAAIDEAFRAVSELPAGQG